MTRVAGPAPGGSGYGVGCGAAGSHGQANRAARAPGGVRAAQRATRPGAVQHAPGHRRRRDLDRTEKREFVAALASGVRRHVDGRGHPQWGLTVAEATDLRRRMRAAGATYKVAKNRLATLALDGTQFEGIKPLLKGPTALAWSNDPVAVAKTAVEFAKTNDKFVVLGGALGTQTLDADGIKALSELPSLDDAARAAGGDDSDPRHPDRRRAAGAGRTARAGLRRPMPRRTRPKPRRPDRCRRMARLRPRDRCERYGRPAERACMEPTRT